jgi:hypothetical protein
MVFLKSGTPSATGDRPRAAAHRFYVAGGTMPVDSPSYVERRADRELHESLRRGEFCYVLTSRQMGKSSLMVRTAARLRDEGIVVAVLDLTVIGQNLTAEQWYAGLMIALGEQLGREEELWEFWCAHPHLGPLQRWMAALREVVLQTPSSKLQAVEPGAWSVEPGAAGQRPLVIFLDEIDAVRSLPFPTDEFFAAIRACYNRRAEHPEFERLTFCLLGVATPADLIQDTRATPFNIGRRIELTDLTEADAAPLAAGLRPGLPAPGSRLPARDDDSAPTAGCRLPQPGAGSREPGAAFLLIRSLFQRACLRGSPGGCLVAPSRRRSGAVEARVP